MKISSEHRNGFTLTEAAIVCAILGVVLVVLWIATDRVYTNVRVANASQQLVRIVQGIRSIYGTTQYTMMDVSITGLDGALTLARAGAIPVEMWNDPNSPTRIEHPWGGPMGVYAQTLSTPGDSFIIGFLSMPKDACMNMLYRNTGEKRDGGLVAAGSWGVMQGNFPINFATASSVCSYNYENDLLFTFKLKS